MKAELPELELVRRDLERELVGRKVKTAAAAGMSALPRYKNRKSFANQLDGVKINGVLRQGEYLLFPLDSEDIFVVKMGTGMLRRNANKDKEEKGTEVTITFTQGGQLRYVDPDNSGEVAVVPKDDVMSEFPDLNDPAIDAIDTPLSWLSFRDILEQETISLKELLTNGKVLVGIGSLYADEVLFDSGLATTANRPTCPPKKCDASTARSSRPCTTPSNTGERPSKIGHGQMYSENPARSTNTCRSMAAKANSVHAHEPRSNDRSSRANGPTTARRRFDLKAQRLRR